MENRRRSRTFTSLNQVPQTIENVFNFDNFNVQDLMINKDAFLNGISQLAYPELPSHINASDWLSCSSLSEPDERSEVKKRRLRGRFKSDSNSLYEGKRLEITGNCESRGFGKNDNDISKPITDGTVTINTKSIDVKKSEHSSTISKSNFSTKKMYYENVAFYNFRQQLRDSIDITKHSGIQIRGQKSGKLFKSLLMHANVDDWVLNSITSAVKNDKDINMTNFTKRKIKVLNNVPVEHVSIFMHST